MMERATIKTAIDILDQIHIADAFDEQLIINVAETLEQCDNEIARLQARNNQLEKSLHRIVSYYDLAKSGSSLPALTMQARAEHENTMFGEARKLLGEK